MLCIISDTAWAQENIAGRVQTKVYFKIKIYVPTLTCLSYYSQMKLGVFQQEFAELTLHYYH